MKSKISKLIVTADRLSYRAKKSQIVILCICSLLFSCLASLYFGTDIGYDLKNYHLYNAWALLQNRNEVDLFAAGMHTYVQPLLDVPYYWLSYVWFPDSPKLVCFLSGIPGGIFLVLTTLIVFVFLKSAIRIPRIYLYILSIPFILFGITNSFFIQIGYTSGDLPVACLALGAVYAFLRYQKRLIPVSIFSGLLIGIAVGLKLSAAAYFFPLFLAIIFFIKPRKQKIQTAILFAMNCGIAFLAIYGFWGWRLYQETGNPVFPVFDKYSPKWLYPSVFGDDIMILVNRPDGFWNKFFSIFTTYHFGLVNVFILFFFFLVALKQSLIFIRRSSAHSDGCMTQEKKEKKRDHYVFLFIFYLGTFLIGRYYLSEIRYIMALDAMAGILIFSGILQLHNFKMKQVFLLALFSIGIFGFIKKDYIEARISPTALRNMLYQGGWRYSGKEPKWKVPVLPENTLVLTGIQTSFLAPFLTQQTASLTFVGGVSDFNTKRVLPDSIMKKKIADRIREHKGAIYLLTTSEVTDKAITILNLCDKQGRLLHEINFFPQYGLKLELEKQIRISNKFGNFLLIPTHPENTVIDAK